jgi:hypothetical protein
MREQIIARMQNLARGFAALLRSAPPTPPIMPSG